MWKSKCEYCGGEMEVNAENLVAVCKYCDSTFIIPKDIERKGQLYNRAIFLRQNNEFDKAVSIYEDILKTDNGDADAHWGLVLSKYGIEYVLDPRTGKRIPTCHRTKKESILNDPDYLAAIEYADFSAKEVMCQEAQKIHEIQSKIIEISKKEQPYDIFICYKESDEAGNRTEDSILAQELYFELEKKGYKVFFARKTLESKLGTEYEPVIFAALNSAKVMIVVGTKPEHFNAIWVRNEWSRYMELSKDSNKKIIPAYRGMSPYELPIELSSLQSQDMAKIGFMQDLTDGIERVLRSGVGKKSSDRSEEVRPLERLLQNAQTYLKLQNYSDAEEVYVKITKEYPEEYRGWWGLIVCATKDFTEILTDFTKLDEWYRYVKILAEKEFEQCENIYLDYAKRVADLELINEVKRINDKINECRINKSRIKKEIDSVKRKIVLCKEEYEIVTKRNNEKIVMYENRIKEAKRSIKFDYIMYGSLGIGMGIILSFAVGFWGIVAGIGMILFYYIIEAGEHKNRKKEIEESIQNFTTVKTELEKEVEPYHSRLEQYKSEVTNYKKEVQRIMEIIGECKKYLEFGEENIGLNLYRERCEQFGVKISCDRNIILQRAIVFSEK